MLDFEGASEGLKKIFKGEIFDLISALLAIVTGLIAAFTTVAVAGDSKGGTIVGATLILVIAIVMVVLSIISLVFIIQGLNRVGKNEKCFMYALALTIVDIILMIVLSAAGKSEYVSSASGCCNAIAMILIIQGCMNLNEKKGKPEIAKKGKKILYVIIVAMLISIAASFIVTIATTVTQILAVIGAIISVACLIYVYIRFLTYLRETARELLN